MTTLKLSPEQAEALKDALKSHVSDLRMEIADTENRDFRESLKRQEALLKQILDMLT